MILAAQLELQYAKSSLFTCSASRSGSCVQGQWGDLQHTMWLNCIQESNEEKGALENNSNKLLFWTIIYTRKQSQDWQPVINTSKCTELGNSCTTRKDAAEASRQKLQLPGAGWELPQEISTAPGTHLQLLLRKWAETNFFLFSISPGVQLTSS